MQETKAKKYLYQKGITLIALVITIVVLLILASVLINSIKDNNIIKYAKLAKTNYIEMAQKEQQELDYLTSTLEENVDKWVTTGQKVVRIKENKEKEELNIGDYVNYIQNTQETGYTSLASNNGNSNQSFTVDENTTWQILGTENGKLKLIATNTVGSFSLYGEQGHFKGAEELDNICAIYGTGNGAQYARSAKIEDINNACGYTPEASKFIKYACNDNNSGAVFATYADNANDNDTSFLNIVGNQQSLGYTLETPYWTLDVSQSIRIRVLENTSYGYEVTLDMLNNKDYWLSSQYTQATVTGCNFGLRCVYDGSVDIYMLINSDTTNNTFTWSSNVRPVVILDSDVNLTWDEANNVWNLT